MSIWKRSAIAVLPTVIFLAAGEAVIRSVYFVQSGYKTYYYLTAPFGSPKRETLVYSPEDAPRSFGQTDPVTGRPVLVRHADLGRVPFPPSKKPEGWNRIISIGGSSTYGITNTDYATWPAQLEEILRAEGTAQPWDVINCGYPGQQLDDFVHRFSTVLYRYDPDVVLLYEAWNDAYLQIPSQADAQIRRFHRYNWIGKIAGVLYYRSMLYTWLLEKLQFWMLRNREPAGAALTSYEARLKKFVDSVREHGATPVFVIQLVEPAQMEAIREFRSVLRQADWEDRDRTEKIFAEAVKKQLGDHDLATRWRIYQTLILEEALRRRGKEWGVQVIEPESAFVGRPDYALLFMDIVHLTDAANGILARKIAAELRRVR